MTDKFTNANGELTMYALSCGYVQTENTGPVVKSAKNFSGDIPDGPRYTIALSGNGASWDVRVSDERLPSGLAAWEQFDRLTTARQAFRRAVRHYSRHDLAKAEPVERDASADADLPAWAMVE